VEIVCKNARLCLFEIKRKMKQNKSYFCYLMLFYFRKEKNATQTKKYIVFYGEDIVIDGPEIVDVKFHAGIFSVFCFSCHNNMHVHTIIILIEVSF